MRSALVCSMLSVALLGGREALAAPATDPAVTARAAVLFRAGRAAAQAGDDKGACEKFTESQKLQPAPGTQLNLGACEAKQGHLLAAREHYRQAATGFGPEDVRRAVAVNSANDLTDRLATVTIHLAETAPAGTTVTIDGAVIDAKALARGVELDPGRTSVVVKADQRQPRSYDLEVAEAEKRPLEVDVGDPVAPEIAPVTEPEGLPPPETDDARRSRSLQRTLGYVGVGTGAAGIVVGSIFGAMAFHQASVVKANCDANLACKPAGVSAASSGQTDGVVSTTMFVVGAALAAGGAYLVIRTWPKASNDPAPTSVTVAPTAFQAGGGMVGTWVF